MAEESKTQSGKAWDKASSTFAKIVDLSDPQSVSSITNRKLLEAVEAALPLSKATFLIDMGTGTGPVITAVLSPPHVSQLPSSARLVAADTSAAFLGMLDQTKQARVGAGEQAWSRLEAQLWDGRELQVVLRDGEVSHLLSAFCYFTMVDEDKGLSEALRVLAPGGVFASTSMGDTEWGDLQYLVEEVRSDLKVPRMARHWQTAPAAKAHIEQAGFANVRTEEFDIGINFDSCGAAADFVISSFPALQEHFAAMTEGEKGQVRDVMIQNLKKKHPTDPIRLTGTGVLCVASK